MSLKIKSLFSFTPYLFFVGVLLLCGACYSSELRDDARVHFVDSQGVRSTEFTVQIAKTPTETSKGLMYRRNMPEKQGMLFIFEGMSERSFWMKNTYLSLDMIFIDKDGKVVHIIPDVPPLTLTSRKSKYPCRYVLELNAGMAKLAGITVGSVMRTTLDDLPSGS